MNSVMQIDSFHETHKKKSAQTKVFLADVIHIQLWHTYLNERETVGATLVINEFTGVIEV